MIAAVLIFVVCICFARIASGKSDSVTMPKENPAHIVIFFACSLYAVEGKSPYFMLLSFESLNVTNCLKYILCFVKYFYNINLKVLG